MKNETKETVDRYKTQKKRNKSDVKTDKQIKKENVDKK